MECCWYGKGEELLVVGQLTVYATNAMPKILDFVLKGVGCHQF